MAAFAYSFIVTFVLLKLVDALVGLRVTTEEEEIGLDLTQHGERGYIMGIGELMGGVHEEHRLDAAPVRDGQRTDRRPSSTRASDRLRPLVTCEPAGPSCPAGLLSNGRK